MIVQVAGGAVALGLVGVLVSGLAVAGSDGDHGSDHTVADDGSMVHDGVTYYAGPASEPIPAAVLDAAEPTGLRIPSIGVASDLLHLGIAEDGSAEVPQDYDLAGWFDGGGRPGVVGPTVLLGHVDSQHGPAIFHRLRELRPGDEVEVLTRDGTVARYAVQRSEQVPKDEFPTFAVFGASPDDVLRLVTCAGEFDEAASSYQDNVVVHATRIA